MMEKEIIDHKPRPFIKWLGGKSRMIKHIMNHASGNYNRYYEPFLGGGSLLLHLAHANKFKEAIVSDMNYDVINAWNMIKKNVDELINELQNGDYLYKKESYMEIRALNPEMMDPIKRAARFLYLNKTCFNGIWRVNQKGQFNVPFGKYKDPQICDANNLSMVSKYIQQTEFLFQDFESCLQSAKKGDLVYFDPPYAPISDTSNFSSYTPEKFLEEDHVRLSKVFKKLSSEKILCIMSNSSSSLIQNLYSEYKIVELVGTRSVAGPSDWRKSVTELIIIGGIDNSN